jgi:hypothetical protein
MKGGLVEKHEPARIDPPDPPEEYSALYRDIRT